MTYLRMLTLAGAAMVLPLSAAQPNPIAAGLPDQPIQLQTGPWREATPLISPRAGLSAVVLDGLIYAAGGAGLVEPRADFEVYEPDFGVWRPLTSVPVGLEGFGMAAWQGRIWVAGGYTSETRSEPSALVWSYDPERDIWQSETELAGPKASFSLVALGEQLFAIGGEDGFDGIMVYDPDQVEWSARAAPEESLRRGAAALAVDDEIWVIGGVRDGKASARIDIYTPAEDRWRPGPSLPEPRAGQSAAIIDGRVHLFGGRSADMRTTLNEHWVYDGSRWTSSEAMPVPRTEAASAVLGGEIWLIGGGAGAGFFAPFTAVDSVDVFTPD